MEWRFRAARVDEGDGRALVAAMAAEMRTPYAGLDLDAVDMPAAGPRELGPPHGASVVGYGPDDSPLCCGGFKRLPDGACEIERMYVVPAARRRGLGRRLLGELEAVRRDDRVECALTGV